MPGNGLEIQGLFVSFLQILDQANVPSIVTDGHGKIIFVNTTFLHVTKYRQVELFGKRYRELEALEDLVEIKRREKFLKSNQGHYEGYSIINDEQRNEYFCRVNIEKITTAEGTFFLKQFQLLKNDKAEEFKDLVKIRNTIEKQLPDTKDVYTLSKIVGLDYRRILFLIKEFEGVTPKRYLTGVRLRRCLELMEGSRKTQKEIAFELGFCDVSHLCNVFKNSMNMTITEYLRTDVPTPENEYEFN